jgi:hypothetical protein
MKCWTTACAVETKQFEAIAVCLGQSPQLLGFLFDPDCPKLRESSDVLLREARGFCSGDHLLVKLAIELWCGSGELHVSELFETEPEVFTAILAAFNILAPKSF